MLCHATLCPALPCHAMPYHAMLCHTMPCHAMPCHAMPCHTTLCYATLYHAMPCHLSLPHLLITDCTAWSQSLAYYAIIIIPIMNVYPPSLIVFPPHSLLLSPSMLGIIGDSNTKCLNPPSALSSVQIAVFGELGAKCNSDDECMYGKCTENECVAPPLLCPTNLFGKYIFTPLSLLRHLPHSTPLILQITHLLLIFDLLYTM